MTARKHHYVPQCYLKLFSVSHKKIPQLTVFDRERKKMFKTGIDNVAAQRDFNTIDSEGYDPDTFEKEMSRFESELAEALQRINVARSLADEEDRAYLLNLVGLTALRNPRLRETMRQARWQYQREVSEWWCHRFDRRPLSVAERVLRSGFLRRSSSCPVSPRSEPSLLRSNGQSVGAA